MVISLIFRARGKQALVIPANLHVWEKFSDSLGLGSRFEEIMNDSLDCGTANQEEDIPLSIARPVLTVFSLMSLVWTHLGRWDPGPCRHFSATISDSAGITLHCKIRQNDNASHPASCL